MIYFSSPGEKTMFARLAGGILLPLLLLFAVAVFAAESVQIVCITCHAKLPVKYSEPVRLWYGSIHAENGIACSHCHGGDPKDSVNAMSPARGFLGVPKEPDIPAFCGRCHVGVKNDYLASAHGKALGKGGPTCVTCHGNHLVIKVSLELINEKSCSRCHSFERARLIRSAMQETEGMIIAIDAGIADFKQEGVNTERLEKGLFAVRNGFHSLFHNVDVEKVRKDSAGIQGELKKLDTQLQQLAEARRKRKLAGAAAVSGALVAALLFYLLKRTYD